MQVSVHIENQTKKFLVSEFNYQLALKTFWGVRAKKKHLAHLSISFTGKIS